MLLQQTNLTIICLGCRMERNIGTWKDIVVITIFSGLRMGGAQRCIVLINCLYPIINELIRACQRYQRFEVLFCLYLF